MKINEELFAFKYELGNAIAQWGYIEHHLLNIALNCVSLPDRNALAIGYHSIENFRAKLTVCDNLVTHKFRKSGNFPKWKALYDRLKTASSSRNKIAHGWHKLYAHNTAGRRWAIIPIHHANGALLHASGAKPPAGAICLRDLVAIRLGFHALTTQACNVYELLTANRAPFPESSERAESPPTIRSLRNQMFLELGLQPAPLRKKS